MDVPGAVIAVFTGVLTPTPVMQGFVGNRRGNQQGMLRMPSVDESTMLLDVRGLGIGFGQRMVLADISFALQGQGIIVLMGPGGTGKSTLLHYLSGAPSSSRQRSWGDVDYLGRPLGHADAFPALVQQQARDLGLHLFDSISAGMRGKHTGTIGELREIVIARLGELALERLVPQLDKVVVELPPAQVRLAGILRNAFTDAPLLMIDEPTTGLATQDADEVLDVIERLAAGRACLVTLHNQAQARRIARRVILIAGGRVQADAPVADFFANPSGNPVLAQFLRTGSCYVAAPDAQADQLDEDAAPPPLPAAARFDTQPAEPPAISAPTPAPEERSTPSAAPPLAAAPSSAEFAELLSAAAPAIGASVPPDSRGPTGFHWLVPGKLAGCPKPGVVAPLDHDLALLKGMGITLLINLTEHAPNADALARHGLKSFHMRVEDRHAPPLLWAKLLLAKMATFMRNGEVLAVHCLAGLGRTGTILCAWLVREGLTADEALRRLRTIDAGFVQTREQENLLHELETNLLIRASN